MSMKIKAGDDVVVIAGNDRGTRGKVLQVLPQKGRVLVEGVNKRKHHEKAKSENERYHRAGKATIPTSCSPRATTPGSAPNRAKRFPFLFID